MVNKWFAGGLATQKGEDLHGRTGTQDICPLSGVSGMPRQCLKEASIASDNSVVLRDGRWRPLSRPDSFLAILCVDVGVTVMELR